MTSKILLTLCLILAGGHSAATAGHPPRVETILPANTDVLLVVEDAPSFLAKWPESPWSKLWGDPELRAFLAPLRGRLHADEWEKIVRETTGHSLEEILDNFSGQVALAIPNLSELTDEDEETEGVEEEEDDGDKISLEPMIFLAAVADPALTEILLAEDFERRQREADPGETIRERTETYRGVTLHLRSSKEGREVEPQEGWAILNGLLVLAEPVSHLKEVVDSIQSGDDPRALVHNEAYQAARKRIPDAHTYGFFNFLGVRGLFEEGLAEEMEEDGASSMGITATGISGALALDALRCAYFGTQHLSEETSVEYGVLYTEERGIINLAAYLPGPCTLPSFLPPHVLSAGAARFSIVDMWQGLVQVARDINPGIGGMLEQQVRHYALSLDVDFETEFLGSLGQDLFLAHFPRPEGAASPRSELDQVFGISLTNPPALTKALEALISSFDPEGEIFKEREYRGATIHMAKKSTDDGQGQEVSYAVTDQYFLLSMGTATPLETIIDLMARPETTIWDRADLKPLLEEIPKNASAVGFFDVGAMIRQSLHEARLQMDAEEGEDKEDLVDWSADPDLDRLAGYFGPVVGAVFKTPEGIYSTSRMIHPKR